MTDWIERARELLADGMSVNAICREVGKSETAVRFNLDINGYADRCRARRERWKHRQRPSRAGQVQTPDPDASRSKAITLPAISLSAVSEAEPVARRIVTASRYRADPGVARIREIHQRMIRQGKIGPGRDLLSEWRS